MRGDAMRRVVVLGLLLAGCGRAPDPPAVLPAVAVGATSPPEASRDAGVVAAVPAAPEKLVADEEVGPLLARLSENPGDFPSENYVTNEISLLDVAPLLRDPKLRDRAYVGVGPEQNYTYVGLLEPRVAYIVDIRRGNLLEHMVFRGCFEAGTTRAEFLSALLARRTSSETDESVASQAAAFRAVPPDAALREQGIARTKALLDRLHVARARGDDATITRIHRAFATHGLSIAYTMTRAPGEYPTLAETLAARDPEGEAASFLGTEERYVRVRRLVMENRVLPIVGDFGGARALRAVGEDMRERGLVLGVLYASNVEQYLFNGPRDVRHAAFVASIRSMPRDDASRLVRVWFDPKPDPTQHPTHRTTQLTIPVNTFLARAAEKPFKNYREVTTQTAP
jgi:hypothetical protein